jgi:hypothetical protein
MAARRALSRRAHCALLVIHVCGAVGWIAVIATVVALDTALTVWPIAAVALDTMDRLRLALTIWVLAPCVAACLATGVWLSGVYASTWPSWLRAKVGLTAAVLALGGLVLVGLIVMPGPLLVARSAGLMALTVILVLSVARPGRRRRSARIVVGSPTLASSAPVVGKGRHRK